MPQIAFSASKEEKDNVTRIAKDRGKTVSHYIHDLVSDAIQRDTQELETVDETIKLARMDYRAGGMSEDDIKNTYFPHKGREEVRAILKG